MKDIFYQNKKILILNFLIFMVAFSLPFSFAFNSISIILFIIYSFLFFKKKNVYDIFKKKEIYLLYVSFFFFQLFSISYSYDKNLAIENVIKNVIFLLFPIAFLNLKNKISITSLRFLYFGLLASVSLSISKVFFIFIISLFSSKFSINNFLREKFVSNGLYDIHVPYFSMLIVLLVIFSFKVKFSNNKKTNILIQSSVLFLLILSLILLSGFMSIVILFIYFTVKFIISNFTFALKLTTGVFFTTIILFSFLFLSKADKLERVVGSENIVFRIQNFINSNDDVRVQNWKSVIDVISENFLLGVGADGGMEELLKKRMPLAESFVNKHNAHNDFLEVFLRYGLIGFCIYSSIIFFLIRKAISASNYFFNWFLIIFLLSGITESYLQRQIGLVFFVFLSLFFFTLANNKNKALN